MASEPVLAGNELFPPPMLKYYYGYKPRIGRKMRVLLSKDSPIWHTAVVKSYIIVASNKNGYEWKQPSIVLEFDNEKNDDDNNDDDGNDDDNDGRDDGDVDDKSGSVSTNFPPGAYVKIQGLVNASHHNGRCGIVLGRQEQQQQPQGKKGKKKKTKDIASLLLVRYKVQISNDNILSIKPQNLIKKSLNNSPKDDDDDDGVGGGYHRLIYRIHPSIGGILTGKTSKGVDASEKISFEWIDGEKDDKKEMNNENKEEDGVEAKKEKEKEENEKENTTLAIATRSSSFQQGDYVVIYGLGEKHTSTSTSTGISEQNNCQYYGMVLSIPRNNNNDNYQYKVRIVKSETNNNNKSECGGGELVTPDTEIILVHKSNMKFVERNVFPPIVPIPIKDVVDLTIATLGLDDPIYLETLNKKRKNPSPLNITLLNPDLLEDKFIRLITAGDSVALGKFLLEVDVDYIFRRLGEENFNLLKHDIAWTLDIKIMILCVSLYCKKLGLTTWFVSAEEKYHTAKKSLYVGTTIALATSIAEDITLNHNYGIWPEALKWVQLVVEESESLSSRLDLSSSLKNGFESIHGFNYTELIKTNVKIGNFGKAVELSQGATHVVEQNGVSEMLKKFDFEDVELDFLNEWPKVTAMYCLLEEQRRFMKIRYGVTNFRIIKNGATDHVTQNDFDCCYKNCPIQYPCFPSLLPVSQKVLDKIQDKDVRDTYEQMMNGNFEVDWIDRDELLWLSFSASSGPLRSERVLSGMNIKTNHERAAVFAEGGIYGIVVQDVASMAGTSDGSFKKYLTDDEKLKMSYRLTHIFVRRYASSLQKINPKSIWQYLIKHYTNNKKWKDAYDAQRMLTTSVMAAENNNDDDSTNTTLAIATRSSSFQQGDYVVIYGLGEKHTSTSTSTGISEQNNCQYYGMVLSIPRNNNNDNYQYKVRIVKSETNNNNKSECGGGELVTPDTEIILVHKSNMKFVERNVFPPIVPIPIKDVVDLTIATLGLDDPIYLETLNKKRKNPSPLNITLLNPDLLEDKFIRLITAGDSVALGKFLLEVDVDYIFRRLGEENFNLLKHDIAWTLDIKIMILCVSLYCKKLGLTTWFVSAEEKYHTAKKSLYVGTTIALATSIAEDITLNHNYGIWPEALKWVQLVVEESESLSSRLDLSSSLKNGFESIHGFNYTELIKTNVKIGNFGKAVELSQGATHVVEQNGVSEMLKKFDFEDVELDFLNEWPKVTAMYCLLEEQRRFMKIRYGVTNFRIIKNGATDHVTQNDFDCCYKNCPIQYPCFPSLLPVSQKVLDKIQDKDVRDTYEQMMNGNFEVDWIDRDELLWLSFSASSGPLRSERVLSGMNIKTNHERAAVFAEGGIYGIVVQDVASMAGTSDGSFKKYLTDDEKLKMSYRLTHIFVRRYASSLQKINPKSIWQYLIKHYTNNKKWKDAYDAQRMLTTSVMAAENNNDDDSTNTTKYNVCCQIGEALEAIGKYQDAGCAYYQASKFFKPGSHDSQGGSHVMNLIHNAGLAYKRNMQYELAGKYFIEALHYGSQLSSSAKRWDFNERECSNVINSMLNNYNRRVREATLDGNTCNKVNSVFMSFLCLLYVSGFKSSTCCEEFRIGRSMYNIVLKTQYRKKKIAKQTLFNALVTGNVEEFESSMERTTTPGTDKMHLQANMDMPTKKDIKQASREQLRDNETIQATSSLFLHQCTRCDKHLENMLQCPCRTVS